MKKVLTAIGLAAAGFVAGILTAPKSGKETRADFKKKADEMKKEADKKTKEAKKFADEKLTQAKAAAKDSVESIKSGAQKVGDAAAETARDVKGNVEKRFK